jgi:ribosomal protein S18 acetylase RimI-like enzyme
VDYRFPAGDPVPAPPEVGFARIRTARASDAGVLAELHARAYSDDPVESTLFRERPDRLTDARHAIRGILGTGLGEWWPRASFVAERSGAALGATLVNGFHGPLITEVLVHPDYRRRGLATHLLARSVEAIRERTSDVPRLVVTETNQRAVALYQGFGFKVDLSSRGRVGLRRSLIHT